MTTSAWTLAQAVVTDREAFAEVRAQVHTEIINGGKNLSKRQRTLTEQQQVDFVPTIAGILCGLAGISVFRSIGLFRKSNRLLILLPAIPCYVVPYQAVYHYREAVFLMEMMREDQSCKLAKRLRASFEAKAAKNSVIVDELEAGSEIPDE
eukprot:gnl/TRDRNA2_/TRDRNA2_28004_c0_seq1.p1 gnl/TRDRNA2_/TRDRNA2_28004_c0~~gnl/TRDRNA2_/TRDRNA2_28004_c0_seq1.p1  ORF type:complete len:151 (-),score=29.85 gnl/TRDRNA2_/TRDRNA2_28004_c0_seq1:61-513(-)